MTDGEDIARRATRAFEAAGDRLAERGVSDADIGRALVAAGLSRWSRGVNSVELVEDLAQLVGGLAAATGVNIGPGYANENRGH